MIPQWKRNLDLACIALSLPVLLPVSATIALGIRIVSPGPILFRQERTGRFGKPFTCLKFRTLRPDAETRTHEEHLEQLVRSDAPMQKLDASGDPRVIPFGKILRASGLDELPQLLNVVRGEMSLVGPRPCTPREYGLYLPQQKERFNAVPGLTGLWQVSGKNNTTFNQMIALDIEYARGCSLWIDLKILAKTFSVVWSQIIDLKQRTVATHFSREKTS